MDCTNLTTAFSLDCKENSGGIKAVYIGNDIDITGVTGATDGIGSIEVLSGTGTFFEYKLPPFTGTFTNTVTNADINTTTFWTETLTINLQGWATAKRNEFILMTQSRELRIIIKDTNDNFWFVGYGYGAYISELTADIGTALGDKQTYNIVLTALDKYPAYSVASPLADSIVAGGFTLTEVS